VEYSSKFPALLRLMTKIAIIDMGTNTFHLLLAEVGTAGYRILLRDHEAVKIGMEGINDGFITESACQRALQAMEKFRKTIDENPVSTVYAFGTSALRNAKNGPALAEEIKSLTGISIQIISGDQEADLIFAGVKAALDLGNDINLVMDIGAGSVEFIIGDHSNIYWKQSFEIGGQRLLERFQKHDPISPEEIQELDIFFEKSLRPLLDAIGKFRPNVLVGSSGTFDTLSDIFSVRQGIARTFEEAETPLSFDGFYEIYHELLQKNRSERMKIEGMIALRVDMIVVACCLIRFVLEKHSFERVRVSTYSLKEGVLANLADRYRNA
jgi:exopolyphosphatase / guanosine-5'-triphosphate,3'-diphosphate pyrophosphatase